MNTVYTTMEWDNNGWLMYINLIAYAVEHGVYFKEHLVNPMPCCVFKEYSFAIPTVITTDDVTGEYVLRFKGEFFGSETNYKPVFGTLSIAVSGGVEGLELARLSGIDYANACGYEFSMSPVVADIPTYNCDIMSVTTQDVAC